jgi:hypothetical protein
MFELEEIGLLPHVAVISSVPVGYLHVAGNLVGIFSLLKWALIRFDGNLR